VAAIGTRPRYHHGDLRNALVDAALRLVREQGAPRFSLREAARTVGVSPSACYRHFADRDALLAAVVEDGSLRLAAAMEAEAALAITGLASPRAEIARLWAYTAAYVRFAAADPSYHRAKHALEGCPHAAPADAATTLAFAAIDDLFAHGVLAEDVRPRALIAAYAGSYGLASLVADGALPVDVATGAVDAVMRTMLVGLGAPLELLPAAPPTYGVCTPA
jgi:AcrR family transcriptional regulator